MQTTNEDIYEETENRPDAKAPIILLCGMVSILVFMAIVFTIFG